MHDWTSRLQVGPILWLGVWGGCSGPTITRAVRRLLLSGPFTKPEPGDPIKVCPAPQSATAAADRVVKPQDMVSVPFTKARGTNIFRSANGAADHDRTLDLTAIWEKAGPCVNLVKSEGRIGKTLCQVERQRAIETERAQASAIILAGRPKYVIDDRFGCLDSFFKRHVG
jgi:hypothetical protein